MKKIFLIVGGSVFLVGAILFGAFFAGPMLASAQTGQSTTAATSTATTATNTYCEQYLQDLAKRLGVSDRTIRTWCSNAAAQARRQLGEA